MKGNINLMVDDVINALQSSCSDKISMLNNMLDSESFPTNVTITVPLLNGAIHRDGNNVVLQNVDGSTFTSPIAEDVMSTVISGGAKTAPLSAVLQSVEESARFDELMSVLLQEVSVYGSIDRTKVMAIVDSYYRADDPYQLIGSVKRAISRSTANVNTFEVLSLIEDVASSAQAAVNGGTLELPDGGRLLDGNGYLVGILSTVAQGIASVLLLVGNAIGKLLGLVLTAVSTITNLVFNYFRTRQQTEVNVALNLVSTGNTYCDTPLWLGEIDPGALPDVTDTNGYLNGAVAKLCFPGLDVFVWRADLSGNSSKARCVVYGNGTFDVSSYVANYSSAERFSPAGNYSFLVGYDKMHDFVSLSIKQRNADGSITRAMPLFNVRSSAYKNMVDNGQLPLLDLDKLVEYAADQSKARFLVATNLMAFGLFCYGLGMDNFSFSDSYRCAVAYGGVPALPNNVTGAIELAITLGVENFSQYQSTYLDWTYDQCYNYFKASILNDAIINIWDGLTASYSSFSLFTENATANAIVFSSVAPYRPIRIIMTSSSSYSVANNYYEITRRVYSVNDSIFIDSISAGPYGDVIVTQPLKSAIWGNRAVYVPTYPIVYGLNLPNTSKETLVASLVSAAVITIGLTVTAVLVSRVVKKKSAKAALDAQKRLMNAKKAYDENQISFEDYYSQQRKYNFRAKLFGWGSYDAANGWFNSSSGASVAMNNQSQVSEIFNKQVSDAIKTEDGLTDIETAITNIDIPSADLDLTPVIELIRGH